MPALRRLCQPPKELVEAIQVFVAPILLAAGHHIAGWLRLLAVRIARRLGVSGVSAAVIAAADEDALYGVIARCAAVLLPDAAAIQAMIREEVDTLSRMGAVPPDVDMSPIRTSQSRPGDEDEPSPQARDPQVDLRATLAEAFKEMSTEFVRAFSAAAAGTRENPIPVSPSPASASSLERVMEKHLESQRGFFSSHRTANDDYFPPESAETLLALPEYCWPRDHHHLTTIRRAVRKLVISNGELKRVGVHAFVDSLVSRLNILDRTITLETAATLAVAGVTPVLLLEWAVMVDRALPPHTRTLLMAARVGRPKTTAEAEELCRGDVVEASDVKGAMCAASDAERADLKARNEHQARAEARSEGSRKRRNKRGTKSLPQNQQPPPYATQPSVSQSQSQSQPRQQQQATAPPSTHTRVLGANFQ